MASLQAFLGKVITVAGASGGTGPATAKVEAEFQGRIPSKPCDISKLKEVEASSSYILGAAGASEEKIRTEISRVRAKCSSL